MQDAMVASISTFHTTGIILADNSKFSFVGSISEAMFRDVPVASKILEGYRKILVLGFRPLTPEMQSIIAEVDKPKKGGQKGSKKGEKKQSAKEGPSEPANTPKKRKAQDAPIKRKLNKATWKPRSPTPSEREDSESNTHSDVHNEEDEIVQNEHNNTEVPPTHDDSILSPSHSHETTTTPISITPCPPPVSSQPQSNVPLSTPLFTDSTTTTKTSVEPPVSVNASDVGAEPSGFPTGHNTPPISPLRQNDPDMIYGDGEEDLAGFTYIPFNIRAIG